MYVFLGDLPVPMPYQCSFFVCVQGIGPAYSSKATRNGLRMSDLISGDVKAFEERYRALVDWEVRRFPALKRDVDDDLRKLREFADRIRPMVCCRVSLPFCSSLPHAPMCPVDCRMHS